MGKEKPVQIPAVALKDQFQAEFYNRTDVGLQMAVRPAHLQRRVPDFNWKDIHGPENLPGVLGGKHPHEPSAMLPFLGCHVLFSGRNIPACPLWIEHPCLPMERGSC